MLNNGRMRLPSDKLVRAAIYKVPANCSKLDSRDPISQFEALKLNLERINMRLEKARKSGNNNATRTLSDLKGRTIESLQRVALDVARYQDGAQAVSDRVHNKG